MPKTTETPAGVQPVTEEQLKVVDSARTQGADTTSEDGREIHTVGGGIGNVAPKPGDKIVREVSLEAVPGRLQTSNGAPSYHEQLDTAINDAEHPQDHAHLHAVKLSYGELLVKVAQARKHVSAESKAVLDRMMTSISGSHVTNVPAVIDPASAGNEPNPAKIEP